MTQTTKPAKSVSEHIRTLYQRLMDLDARVAKFESRPEGAQGTSGTPPPPPPPPIDTEILAQVVELEHRLRQLETENHSLNELCGQLQEQNEAISNLYVAKHASTPLSTPPRSCASFATSWWSSSAGRNSASTFSILARSCSAA